MTKICILGLGYIGLPTAAMYANHGVEVIGIDINKTIIETINSGNIHIEEPGLKECVQTAIKSGNLRVSDKPELADAFIIAVPTPFFHNDFGEYHGREYKKADMSFVASAAEAITPCLRKGNLVVLESTSPPRTTLDFVCPILEKSGLKAGIDFYLSYSPERVLPGHILKELVENARVIGGIDMKSAEMGRDLYSTFVTGEIVLTDATTAEMVKLMENTYRDINIAIANEFSRLAYRFGVKIREAINIANLHPRVKILRPGPGVGGHCISVDPWFLVESAPDLSNLIYQARMVNDSQPDFVLNHIRKILPDVNSTRIACLGLTYKADVDDTRESPAAVIAEKLYAAGYDIRVFDPHVKGFPALRHCKVETVEEAVEGVDLVVIFVDHSEFKSLPVTALATVRGKRILDTCQCLNIGAWQDAGFAVYDLGGAL